MSFTDDYRNRSPYEGSDVLSVECQILGNVFLFHRKDLNIQDTKKLNCVTQDKNRPPREGSDGRTGGNILYQRRKVYKKKHSMV